MYILKRGFEILGIEFNSTQGHWETAPSESRGGTLGETPASVDDGKLDSTSGVAEP